MLGQTEPAGTVALLLTLLLRLLLQCAPSPCQVHVAASHRYPLLHLMLMLLQQQAVIKVALSVTTPHCSNSPGQLAAPTWAQPCSPTASPTAACHSWEGNQGPRLLLTLLLFQAQLRTCSSC